MKESMSVTTIFQIVILFILLFTAIMALTINNSNAFGIKDQIVNILESNGGNYLDDGSLNQEIVDYISEISNKINREINVAIDRNGNIIDISIGDSSTVNLRVIPVDDKKLSGVRIIHTHPSGNPHLSSVDISASPVNKKLKQPSSSVRFTYSKRTTEKNEEGETITLDAKAVTDRYVKKNECKVC